MTRGSSEGRAAPPLRRRRKPAGVGQEKKSWPAPTHPENSAPLLRTGTMLCCALLSPNPSNAPDQISYWSEYRFEEIQRGLIRHRKRASAHLACPRRAVDESKPIPAVRQIVVPSFEPMKSMPSTDRIILLSRLNESAGLGLDFQGECARVAHFDRKLPRISEGRAVLKPDEVLKRGPAERVINPNSHPGYLLPRC